ncbi:MAG: hypothetical protein RKO24_14780 [Candidatus Competibacter sp.]|nr:hypothetical protein [Candidatus Competibacter sp.]
MLPKTDQERDNHSHRATAYQCALFLAPAPADCQRELRGGERLPAAVRQSLDHLTESEVADPVRAFSEDELIAALLTPGSLPVLLSMFALRTTHRLFSIMGHGRNQTGGCPVPRPLLARRNFNQRHVSCEISTAVSRETLSSRFHVKPSVRDFP